MSTLFLPVRASGPLIWARILPGPAGLVAVDPPHRSRPPCLLTALGPARPPPVGTSAVRSNRPSEAVLLCPQSSADPFSGTSPCRGARSGSDSRRYLLPHEY